MRYGEERRRYENTALRQSIADVERLGSSYADLMLMDTTVHIDLDDMQAMFTLPPKTADVFQYIGAPIPQLVDRMNLDLQYDRWERHFSILRGAVAFDNGYGIGFRAPKFIPLLGKTCHMLDVFRYDTKGNFQFQEVGPSPVADVQSFFAQCGIEIPMAPTRAAWGALAPTLDLAKHRVLTAQRTTPITATYELQVIEQIIESDPTLTEEDLAPQASSWLKKVNDLRPSMLAKAARETHEQAWLREVSLQVIDSRSDVGIRATEVVLITDSHFEEPRFQGIFAHSTPRTLVSSQRPPHPDTQKLTPLNEEDLVTLRPEITQYITFITQALRAASNDLLG